MTGHSRLASRVPAQSIRMEDDLSSSLHIENYIFKKTAPIEKPSSGMAPEMSARLIASVRVHSRPRILHSQRNTLVERAVHTPKIRMSAAVLSILHPFPSQTPCMSETA